MFIKSTLSKFIWDEKELPENITSTFVENIILTSSTENFCVVDKKSPFFTNNFVVLEREERYGFPSKIQATTHKGKTITAGVGEFILFSDFKIDETPMNKYINYYSKMIADINDAIRHHIIGSKLICTMQVKNSEDKKQLETIFKDFTGIKIFKAKDELDVDGKDVNIIQFEVNNQMEVLERTKRELERDLWARLGVLGASDKTHQIEVQATNGEQGIDLLNAYELGQRKRFCKKYNDFSNRNLTVKIHSVNSDNSIDNETEKRAVEDGNN